MFLLLNKKDISIIWIENSALSVAMQTLQMSNVFTQHYSVDPDGRSQNVASHQGLHCLPVIQQFLNTKSDSKLYLFKFYHKYGKELM